MKDHQYFGSEKLDSAASEIFARFNNSFEFDRRLFRADVRVSIAYADALFYAGVVTRLEAEKIRAGLETLLKRADFDKNYFANANAPDVHSFIEIKLVQLIGETGGKLQIGRSRADQSATALRLWLREKIERLMRDLSALQKTLFDAATRYQTEILPAYVHRRRTAPILWAHWFLAYFEMFARDRERLDEVWRRTNIMPLGAATPAGNSFEIDREALAKTLGFEGITNSALDALADRDFAVEFVGASALTAVHLSRLAEDLILYASAEFDFINFPGAFGASVKTAENIAVALENMRAKAGKIFGYQNALLSVLKNLPLAYSSDLNQDGAIIFDTAEIISDCLQIAAVVLRNTRVNEEKSKKAAATLNVPELTDYLIKKNLPFNQANELTAVIVAFAAAKNKELKDLSLNESREFERES